MTWLSATWPCSILKHSPSNYGSYLHIAAGVLTWVDVNYSQHHNILKLSRRRLMMIRYIHFSYMYYIFLHKHISLSSCRQNRPGAGTVMETRSVPAATTVIMLHQGVWQCNGGAFLHQPSCHVIRFINLGWSIASCLSCPKGRWANHVSSSCRSRLV